MKIKLYQILDIQTLCLSLREAKLKLKTAYKFTKLLHRLEEESKFYQEKFSKILSDCGQKEETGEYKLSSDGRSVLILPEKLDECNARIEELRNLEVEMDDFKFSLEELEGVNLTIMEMNCLMPLIEE